MRPTPQGRLRRAHPEAGADRACGGSGTLPRRVIRPENRGMAPSPAPLRLHDRGVRDSALGPPRSTEFTRLHVSDISLPQHVRLRRSFESEHTSDDGTEKFAGRLGLVAPPVRLDSQAKYAVLAGGKAEILLRLLSPQQPNYRERIWDQAAGSIILEEAGGRITDLHGRPLDFSAGRTLARNRGVLATNGIPHAATLEALA